MNLDCTRVSQTPKAHALLVKYGLCGYGAPAGVTPDSQACGNCGCLNVTLTNGQNGWAVSTIIVTVTAESMPIFSAYYNATWHNWNSGVSNGFSASTGYNALLWLDQHEFFSGGGFVTDAVNAYDQTAIGPCVGTGSANFNITNP